MRISIPSAAAATLLDILGQSRFQKVYDTISQQDGYYRVTMQNLSPYNVYFESGDPATVNEGTKVVPNSFFSFATDNLAKVSLLAETADATNVRISIT